MSDPRTLTTEYVRWVHWCHAAHVGRIKQWPTLGAWWGWYDRSLSSDEVVS